MKRIRKWLMVIMAMLLLGLSGIPDGDCLTVEAASKVTIKKIVSVDSLTGSKTIKLAIGKKAKLKTTITASPDKSANKKVTYKSSNKKVATVTSNGVITGKKAGTAKITITSTKNKKKKVTVTVKVVKGKVEKIKFSKDSGTLKVGDTKKLKPIVTVSAGGSKDVVWTTSNKKVATVDKKGTVKAVKAGTATITVKAADGTGKKASYKVTVKNNIESVEFAKDTVSSLYVGKQATVKIVCKPSEHGKVSWKTSDSSIVSFHDKGTDTLTIYGNKVGTAVITASVDGISVSREITVKEREPKYKYELNFLNPPYSGLTNIVYIKTDNPSPDDFEVHLSDPNGTWDPWSPDRFLLWQDTLSRAVYRDLRIGILSENGSYKDLKFETDSVNDFYKVSDGYVGAFIIKEAGKYKVEIFEPRYTADGLWDGGSTVNLGYIDVKDYDAEKKAWMQSIIDEATTDRMTKPEKMQAIETYMYNHSVYFKTPSDRSGGYVFLAAEVGIPVWKTQPYEFDSYTSPSILVEFGDMIDYPVESMFYKYKRGTPEWQQWHSKVRSVEDGSYYYFCHGKDNPVDVSTIRQLDLSTWKFYKCYK